MEWETVGREEIDNFGRVGHGHRPEFNGHVTSLSAVQFPKACSGKPEGMQRRTRGRNNGQCRSAAVARSAMPSSGATVASNPRPSRAFCGDAATCRTSKAR